MYFEFAFLLKDSKITYIEDEKELEKLYLEYSKKYPCDTSEVEEEMRRYYDVESGSYYSVESDFHF